MQTGEEQEDLLYRQRSKLFRFRDGEWRERGKGDANLLRNSATGAVRFLMREEKTRKVLANHAVAKMPPYCDLSPGIGSDRAWVWLAQNYAEYAEDGEPCVEQLALKLGSKEIAQQFATAWKSALEQDSRGFVDTTSDSSPKRQLGMSSLTPARKASRLALEDRSPSSSAIPVRHSEEELGASDASPPSIPVRSLGSTKVKDPIPMRSRTLSELHRSEQFFSALASTTEPFHQVEQHSLTRDEVVGPFTDARDTVPSADNSMQKSAAQCKSQVASI
jgi:hypothetical protein